MKLLLSFVFMFFALAASANVEVLEFESTEQEQRYNALIKELRCLVCQNQNLSDANSYWA